MASIVNRTLEELDIFPNLYAHFIEDILLIVNTEYDILNEKNHENLALSSTHENGQSKLPFLDILLETD